MVRKPDFKDKKILIVSEDSKSFTCYFEKILYHFRFQPSKKYKGFIKTIYSSRESIKVSFKKGIHGAKEIVKYANSQSENFDQIYCVFDKTVNQKDPNYKIAIGLETKNNVIIINSSPSYEIWLLFHFIKSDSPSLNDEKVKKDLKQLIRNQLGNERFEYKKSEFSDELFEIFIGRLPNAIKNAKAVEKLNDQTNSSKVFTKIYKLIEDFQKYD